MSLPPQWPGRLRKDRIPASLPSESKNWADRGSTLGTSVIGILHLTPLQVFSKSSWATNFRWVNLWVMVKFHSRELCYHYEHIMPYVHIVICSIFEIVPSKGAFLDKHWCLSDENHGHEECNTELYLWCQTYIMYICVCQVQVWPAVFHWGCASMTQSTSWALATCRRLWWELW